MFSQLTHISHCRPNNLTLCRNCLCWHRQRNLPTPLIPRKGISLCQLPVVCIKTWWSVWLTIQQAGWGPIEDDLTVSLKFNTCWNSNSSTFLLSNGQQKILINWRAFILIRNMFMTICLCWHVTKGWAWTGKRVETLSILDADCKDRNVFWWAWAPSFL